VESAEEDLLRIGGREGCAECEVEGAVVLTAVGESDMMSEL